MARSLGRRGSLSPRLQALALAAVAAAAYLNTLPAAFTFDDSFAVVRSTLRLAALALSRCCAGGLPGPGMGGRALNNQSPAVSCPSPPTDARVPRLVPPSPSPAGQQQRRGRPFQAARRPLHKRLLVRIHTGLEETEGCQLPCIVPPTPPAAPHGRLPARATPAAQLTPRPLRCRGQDLRSAMSHKSWRPLTVLSFRAQHRLGRALLPRGERRRMRPPAACLPAVAFPAAT